MNYILKKWLNIIFLLSVLAISSALIAEFIFDLIPCKICLKQRHTYYAIIILIIIFYLFKQNKNLFLFILNEIAIFYGLFYSIWHVGIEKKIISGPLSCSGTLSKTNSIENLKNQINNQAIINCTDVIWSIFGISAATINSILLILILILNSLYIYKNFYGSEKKA